jgi:protein SSD1
LGLTCEKIAIQNEIEALQRQQAALYQQQLASNQVLSFQTPGLAPNRAAAHRRVQSTIPMGLGGPNNQQQALMSQLGLRNVGVGLDGQPQGVPRGHGRRHSVNVVNKSGSQSNVGIGQDGFEDGFAPPAALGGHSRQVSRADSSWRLCISLPQCYVN